MKRKDVWIIVLVLVVAVVLFVATPQGRGMITGLLAPVETPAPTGEPTPALTPAPTPGVTPGPTLSSMFLPPTSAPRPTLRPAESYVRIAVGGQVVALLPLLTDTTYPVKQLDGKENIVQLGYNRVTMHSATCDNQDCVQQGEITLENKDKRVLYNMVVCLPNQVMLELLTPEEAQAAYEDMV